MYETFFGLKREPFSIAPDPHFLYMSERHREALAHLTYGLRRGAGFVLLTGEIGAGKTTVWRSFLEQLPANFDVANVVNPKLAVNALLMRICEDLHVELPAEGAAVDLIDAIHGHLLLAFARGRRTLIVVDEAQALSAEVMEQLRLLTNLDTSDRKLQVLLIGQPELRTMLERPALEPLAQRVVARFHLPALAEAETTRYIAHRMAVAGLSGEVPFEPDALAQIHRLCRGVPRRINVLCDRTLLLAQTEGKRRIDKGGVDRAAREVFDRGANPTPASQPQAVWPTWLAAGGLAGAALAAGAVLGPLIGAALGSTFTSMTHRASAPVPVVAAAASTAAPTPPATPAGSAPSALGPSAAVLPASGPAAVSLTTTPPTTSASNLDAAFALPTVDEAKAWRALAGLWGASLGSGDACEVAAQQALHCYRGRGGLAPIRQLGRPCLLKLTDDRGRVGHVLLTGLGDDSATLRIKDTDQTVPLTALAQVWRGEFATFWRAPPGYRAGELVGPNGPMAQWLGQRLGLADSAASTPLGDDALKARVFSFQLAHGLDPDGLTGPLTLMQLNRASGVSEPQLLIGR